MADRTPTPSGGNPEGSDLRTIASNIEQLLDDDGQYNPSGQPSRALDPEGADDRSQTRDDRGRFKSATPDDDDGEAQPAVEEPDEDEADLDQAADGDVEDEDSGEDADTDEQLADSADDQPDSDEAETEGAIQTLTDFAEALEVPIEQLLDSITDTFPAAGEDVTVTLSELRAGYQKDADYRRGTQKLSEDRRQAEQDYTIRMQAFDREHALLADHFNVTEHLLTQQMDDPNLARLRQSDPAEWTARREEIGQQIGYIRQQREQARQQYEHFREAQLTELKSREFTILKERMPDFTEAHGDTARETMKSIGYTEDEVAHIFDHRVVLAALELNNLRAEVEQLRAEKAKAKDTVKRVKQEVPRLQKPGKQTAKKAGGIKRDNLAKLNRRLAKSGDVRDAAAVIEQMMQ